MSWKSIPMSPPQRGIGFELNTSSDFSRKSRIQAGSRFISEISATICASSPRRDLNTSCEGVTKSYLLISPNTPWSAGVSKSVAIVLPSYLDHQDTKDTKKGNLNRIRRLFFFVIFVPSWLIL